MAVSKLESHVTEALARILEQFKGKSKFQALITALAGPSQGVEDSSWDIYTMRRLDTATGIELEKIGEIVGVSRGGRSDPQYRLILRAKIRANRSRATIQDLIEVARLIIDDPSKTEGLNVTVTQYQMATAFIELSGQFYGKHIADEAWELLDAATGAAIKTMLVFSATVPDKEFCFANAAFASVAINALDTTIQTSGIPEGVPLSGDVILGEGTANEETVSYTAISGNDLTGVSGVANSHPINTAVSFTSIGLGFGSASDPWIGGMLREVICAKIGDQVTLMPAPAVLDLQGIEPVITGGGMTPINVIPNPAILNMAAVTPALTVGPVSITPAPAILDMAGIDPAVDPGAGAAPILAATWTPLGFNLNPNSNAAYVWDIQNATDVGAVIDETVTGLANNDLVPETSKQPEFIIGQTAVGLYDGTNVAGVKCIESGMGFGNSDGFETTDSILDPGDDSLSVRVIFRAIDGFTGVLISNVDDSSSNDPGWSVRMVGGSLQLEFADTSADFDITSAQNNYDSGAWYCLEATVDWTNDVTRMRILSAGAEYENITNDISTAVQANTATGETFKVFNRFRAGGGGSGTPQEGCQIARIAAATGATAVAWQTEAASLIFPHGGDPNAGTNAEIDSGSYAGVVYTPLRESGSETLFAPWDGSSDQIPLGYDNNGDVGLGDTSLGDTHHGLQVTTDYTNLCPRSEEIESWQTPTNLTVSSALADLIDNPIGLRMARLLTDSGSGGGSVQCPTFAISDSNTYQCQIWVKRVGGSPVDVRLHFEESDGTAIADTGVVSLTSGDWTLLKIEDAATGTGLTATGVLRIEVVTASASVNVAHAGCQENGSENAVAAGLPILTFGSSATMNLYNPGATIAEGDWLEGGTQEVDARGVKYGGGAGSFYLIEAADGSAINVNEYQLAISGNGSLAATIRDSSGTNIFSVSGSGGTNAAQTPCRVRCIHNASTPLTGSVYARAIYNFDSSFIADGGGADDEIASWTATTGIDELWYGVTNSGFGEVEGLVGSIRVYDSSLSV